MKNIKKFLCNILLLAMLVSVLPTNISMAAKKVKLSSKKIIVEVGGEKYLYLKNNTKKVKWKIVSGKKYITLKKQQKDRVKIAGKKKGIAKIQAVIGKKKYSCTIVVKPTVYVDSEIPITKSVYLNLYVLDSGYSVLKMPSSYIQEYQIQLQDAGAASYYVISGDSATVSKTGLITPVATTYYWNGNMGSTISSGKEGEKTTVEYNYGESIIEVMTKDKRYRYIVTVKDYADIYADYVMEDYISKNITSSMTELEKLQKIAEFPCQYDYSPNHCSATGMIVYKGGDCWASTDAIFSMCRKVGLKARVRDARKDPGAGSGHMNVIAKADGKLYVVDAGYVEAAPRMYTIKEIEEYEYSLNSDKESISITKYNGVDSKVVIPKYIDGYLVTTIGNSAFYSCDEIREVEWPDSIEKIEDWAFSDTAIQAVKIPDSVVEVGERGFLFLSDYNGPNGSYGFTLPLEIIELSDKIKKLGINLSESVVLYHGTKEQWNNINFTSSYSAPKAENLFFSSDGMEVSTDNVMIESDKSKEISLYSLGTDFSFESSNPEVFQFSVKNKVREYSFYRDYSGNNVVNKVKTITIKGLNAGKAVLKISDGNGGVKNVSITVVQKEKKSEADTNEVEKPVKVKNLKVKRTSKNRFKISFRKQKNAKGYQIAYDTKRNFKTNKKKFITKNQIILKLKKKKTYYIKVRAYTRVNGKKIYGKWSVVKKVKIKK